MAEPRSMRQDGFLVSINNRPIRARRSGGVSFDRKTESGEWIPVGEGEYNDIARQVVAAERDRLAKSVDEIRSGMDSYFGEGSSKVRNSYDVQVDKIYPGNGKGSFTIRMIDPDRESYQGIFEVSRNDYSTPVVKNNVTIGYTRGNTKKVRSMDVYDSLDDAIAALKRFNDRKAVKALQDYRK